MTPQFEMEKETPHSAWPCNVWVGARLDALRFLLVVALLRRPRYMFHSMPRQIRLPSWLSHIVVGQPVDIASPWEAYFCNYAYLVYRSVCDARSRALCLRPSAVNVITPVASPGFPRPGGQALSVNTRPCQIASHTPRALACLIVNLSARTTAVLTPAPSPLFPHTFRFYKPPRTCPKNGQQSRKMAASSLSDPHH